MNKEYNKVLEILRRLDEDIIRWEEDNKKIAEDICRIFTRNTQPIYDIYAPSWEIQSRVYEYIRDAFIYGTNTITFDNYQWSNSVILDEQHL